MRKLMMLGAMVALALVAATPAIAQVNQGFEAEDVESGDVEPSVDIRNAGDNVNMCLPILQAANTGNIQNQQGVSQYLAYADDIEFEGSEIEIDSELVQECNQVIEQAAAAAAGPAPRPGPPPGALAQAGAVAGPAAAAPAVLAAAGAPPGGAMAKAGGGMLPKTGGPGEIAPLVAAAGLLLVGGGLLAYRRFFMQ